MFFYLYDSFVLDKKNEGTLTRVENRIIELGINGRVEKLTALRNLKELLESAVKKESHTVVIVGDDTTFVRAVNVLAHHSSVALGYIPFSEHSALARVFGIPDTFEACNILSRRVVRTVDLAKANQNFFLTAAVAEHSRGLRIKCNSKYSVSFPRQDMDVRLVNLGDVLNESEEELPSLPPRHLLLKLSPGISKRKWSKRGKGNKEAQHDTLLPIKKAELTHTQEPVPIKLDGTTVLKTPLNITVKAKALKIIVGKERLI